MAEPNTLAELTAQIAAQDAARFADPEPTTEAAPAPEPVAEPATDAPEPSQAAEATDTPADDAEPAPEPSQAAPEPADDPDGTDEARIRRMYAEKRIAERERERLARENEVLRGQRIEEPDEQVDRLATQRAQELAQQSQWDQDVARIRASADKEFGDFQPAIAAFQTAFGHTPGELIAASIAGANGDEHRVLHWLSNNLDEAERIMKLQPMQQGAAIARIAAKVSAPPPPKAQTKAPPPIPRVAAAPVEPAQKDPADMDMAEFYKWSVKNTGKNRGFRFSA